MKRKICFLGIAIFLISFGLEAQDSVLGENETVGLSENNVIDANNSLSQPVKIRVGRGWIIYNPSEFALRKIKFDHIDDFEFQALTSSKPRFDGHWSGIEFGMNSLVYACNCDKNIVYDYFLAFKKNRSFEVNLNFFDFSIALQKVKRNLGLVTGLGLSFNDYHFLGNQTIEELDGQIVLKPIKGNSITKTKLSMIYMNFPLLLEYQMPFQGSNQLFYISGGIVGGIRLGSHTKYITDGIKYHDRDDFNLNGFRVGYTARIGYGLFNLFGTYYDTLLFRGEPGVAPYSFGIGFGNW